MTGTPFSKGWAAPGCTSPLDEDSLAEGRASLVRPASSAGRLSRPDKVAAARRDRRGRRIAVSLLACGVFLTLALLLLVPSSWAPGQVLAGPRAPQQAPAYVSVAVPPITATADADAYTSSATPNQNYGLETSLLLRRGDAVVPVTTNAFLRFDLSAVPAGAEIISAELRLYMTDCSGTSPYTVSLYGLTRGWNETGVTWNNQPPSFGLNDTRGVTPSLGYKAWTVNASLVQLWVNTGRLNNGLVLVPGQATNWSLTFNSRHNETNVPLLVIIYAGPDRTATPTRTPTATRTGTATPTATRTRTATPSPTVTRTGTPTRTATQTTTTTPTVTSTGTITATASGTTTGTPSPTATGTATGTPTVTRTGTVTPTATHSPTPSLTPTSATCGLDTWEPNDTFDTATFIWPGVLDGLICPSGDVDFFQFSAAQGDTITLDLDSLPADYQLRLWSPAGVILQQSAHGGTTPEQIVQVAPSTGSYRAEVWPATGQWNGSSFYELRLQVATGTPAATPTRTLTATPTTPTPTPSATPTVTRTGTVTATPPLCGSDTWEPNDTFDTAAFIWAGGLQGLICPSTDVDFFQFTAKQGDTITLDLGSLPADYNLRLWNPDGTVLEQSVLSGTVPEQIVRVAPSTGSYRAEVWPGAGQWHATDSYELHVQVAAGTPAATLTGTVTPTLTTSTPTPSATPTLTPVGTVTPTPAQCGSDIWEPNDTFGAATFIWPGTLQGLICPSTDMDWFQFNANQYDTITLDLTSLPADYNLRLWKPDQTLLDQSVLGGTTSEQIVRVAPSTGSYRAEVWPAAGQWHATNAYQLRVQVVSTTPRIYLPVLARNHSG